MRHKISASLIRLSILVVALWYNVLTVAAQTTAFSYQGQLNDGGSPANGSYDIQFKLFDSLTAGAQVGSTVSVTNVAVSSGIFTVTLDFGASAFPGANRWLEISVRLAGAGTYTTLTPRQALTSTPYALKSLSTTTADGLSAACVGCVSSTQIGAGSGNYIQNTTTQQVGSNFNISGNGLIGGNVGIGPTPPATRLDAAGTIRSTAQTVPTSGAGLEVIFSDHNGYLTSYDRTGGRYRPLNLNGSTLSLNTISGGEVQIPEVGMQIGVSATATDNFYFGSNVINGRGLRLFNGNSGFGTHLLTVLPNGNVGIGINAPQQVLHVNGNSEILSTGSGAGFKFRNRASASPTDDWTWYSAGSSARLNYAGTDMLKIGKQTPFGGVGPGFVVIGEGVGYDSEMGAAPTYKLIVEGSAEVYQNLNIGGCIEIGPFVIAGICSSDLRLKRQVTPFPNLLDKVTRLQPVHFYWRAEEYPNRHFSNEQSFGLIAQEVEEVLPELVTKDEEGYRAVNYSKLPLMMLQAIKEMKAEQDLLKQQNAALQTRLATLEQMLQQLAERNKTSR